MAKKNLTVIIDRPIGYDHDGTIYPINYGYVAGIMGGDGEEQDAYILTEGDQPLKPLRVSSSQSCTVQMMLKPNGS